MHTGTGVHQGSANSHTRHGQEDWIIKFLGNAPPWRRPALPSGSPHVSQAWKRVRPPQRRVAAASAARPRTHPGPSESPRGSPRAPRLSRSPPPGLNLPPRPPWTPSAAWWSVAAAATSRPRPAAPRIQGPCRPPPPSVSTDCLVPRSA